MSYDAIKAELATIAEKKFDLTQGPFNETTLGQYLALLQRQHALELQGVGVAKEAAERRATTRINRVGEVNDTPKAREETADDNVINATHEFELDADALIQNGYNNPKAVVHAALAHAENVTQLFWTYLQTQPRFRTSSAAYQSLLNAMQTLLTTISAPNVDTQDAFSAATGVAATALRLIIDGHAFFGDNTHASTLN